VSRGLRKDLVARWGADPRRTVAIYNPVLVGPDRNRSEPDAPPTILAAGRLVPDKNTRGLLRAFARVAATHPAHLVVLGEGPERAELEKEVDTLGLGGRVHLPGYVADPWPLYRTATCFATASRLESFSMVVAEALAYGLPVVATDSPGPREVLADGQFGTLVPPGDDAALAEALRAALTRPHDAARAQARGAVFSLEAALEAYGRLFAAVRAEAAGRGRARRRVGDAGREVG
jgi:glycosyltransferase involved in cell wall biosynthesis